MHGWFVVYTNPTNKAPSLVWPPILELFDTFVDPGIRFVVCTKGLVQIFRSQNPAFGDYLGQFINDFRELGELHA
jgi:hypothetical protein